MATLVALAELIGDIPLDRTNLAPKNLLESLSTSLVPTEIEGMFYVRKEKFLSSVVIDDVEYFQLGDNEDSNAGTFLVSRMGIVIHKLISNSSNVTFVNSSLDAFLVFMSGWNRFVAIETFGSSKDLDEEDVIRVGMKLCQSFKKIDSVAFRDDNTWWSRVFEDVELGILGPG